MKKNEKTVAAFKAQEQAKTLVLNNLRKKITENTLSDQAKADAEAVIAEKEAEIQSIKDMIAQLEADPEDKTAELTAKIAELTAKVAEVQNSLAAPKGFLKVKNFIDSKEGMKAFSEAVQNSATGKDFKKNWKNVLVENGLTDADYFLPPTVIDEINDLWESAAGEFLNLLDVTGLLALKVVNETGGQIGRGHEKGQAKDEQTLSFDTKELRAQMVYKYLTIDRETIEFEDNTGALARYIARELAQRVMTAIMRAVLVGDDATITKIEPIASAASAFQTTTTITGTSADFTVENVAAIVDDIIADGEIVMFMHKKSARALRKYIAATGGTVQYKSLEQLAGELGVSKIIETRLLPAYNTLTETAQPIVIAFVGKAYKVVGDLTMKGFENFVLAYNKNEYLTEVYVGGGLGVYGSGAVLKMKTVPKN